MTKEERRKLAEDNFLSGYNCAQALVLSFADEICDDKENVAGISASVAGISASAEGIGSPTKGITKEQLSRLASSFGGGMGRMREVCGAVSGMFMVYGLVRGYDGPETGEVKARHYADIQELAKRFKEKNGTIICRELLGLGDTKTVSQGGKEGASQGGKEGASLTDPTPSPRTAEYYKKRPCNELVGDAAEILHEFLEEKA